MTMVDAATNQGDAQVQKSSASTGAGGIALDQNFDALNSRIGKCNYTAGAPPAANTFDAAHGYSVGSQWLYNGVIYVCTDATTNAATWESILDITSPTFTQSATIAQVDGYDMGLLINGDEYVDGSGSADGVLLLLGVNRSGNRQLWIGDNTALGSSTLGLLRIQSGSPMPNFDATSGDGASRLPINVGTNTSNVGVGFEYSGATGATLPASRLTVNGSASIGGGYIGTAAPDQGLIVQGRVGFGTSSPTAVLHVGAGSATAGFGSLKLTPGTLLTTPEDGTFEYDGSHLYFTIGSTRHTLI